MMARVHRVLKKEYGVCRAGKERPALDELMFAILVMGNSMRRAEQALNALQERYVNWNEVRVTGANDLAEAIGIVDDADGKAIRIRAALSGVFGKEHQLSLETWQNWEPDRVAARLAGVPSIGAGIGARVAAFSFGVECFPVDRHMGRLASRVGLIQDARATDRLRRIIEDCVSKPARLSFHVSLSRHAENVCVTDMDRCDRCVLLEDCPTGRKELGIRLSKKSGRPRVKTVRAKAKAAAKRAVRPKPSKKRRARAAKA